MVLTVSGWYSPATTGTPEGIFPDHTTRLSEEPRAVSSMPGRFFSDMSFLSDSVFRVMEALSMIP